MGGDLRDYARESAMAARMAKAGPVFMPNLIGEWQGISADGQGIALVNGQEVRGVVMAGRGKPAGGRCLVRITPQGNVIQF